MPKKEIKEKIKGIKDIPVYITKEPNTKAVNLLHRFLDKFNLNVVENGRFYDIEFTAKKTGEKIIVPIIGELLDFGDIVAFTDGTSPIDLTKQDWINLYLKCQKK